MLNILEIVKKVEEYIINFRRLLHEEPELSGKEVKTQEKIIAELDKIGLPYKKVGNTSIGYKNREKEAIYFPHHEKFKIDEDYMKYGTAMHVQFALDFLNE